MSDEAAEPNLTEARLVQERTGQKWKLIRNWRVILILFSIGKFAAILWFFILVYGKYSLAYLLAILIIRSVYQGLFLIGSPLRTFSRSTNLVPFTIGRSDKSLSRWDLFRAVFDRVNVHFAVVHNCLDITLIVLGLTLLF